MHKQISKLIYPRALQVKVTLHMSHARNLKKLPNVITAADAIRGVGHRKIENETFSMLGKIIMK